tara:strand:- start:269 stop:442 length:174 start_codon:yes stop_codon:yes gene_type:complete
MKMQQEWKNKVQQRSAFRDTLSIEERLYLLKISDNPNKGFIKFHIERLEEIIEDSLL